MQKDNEPNTNKYQYTFVDDDNKTTKNGKKKKKSKTEQKQEESFKPKFVYVPKVSKFPDRTVCIIGAGPAGIHMASLLIKMGYTPQQIVILEKTNRPCGKSLSIPDPDNAIYTTTGQPNATAPNHYGGVDVVHEMYVRLCISNNTVTTTLQTLY